MSPRSGSCSNKFVCFPERILRTKQKIYRYAHTYNFFCESPSEQVQSFPPVPHFSYAHTLSLSHTHKKEEWTTLPPQPKYTCYTFLEHQRHLLIIIPIISITFPGGCGNKNVISRGTGFRYRFFKEKRICKGRSVTGNLFNMAFK